jgi:cytochrome c-type biogenesis protein CcmH
MRPLGVVLPAVLATALFALGAGLASAGEGSAGSATGAAGPTAVVGPPRGRPLTGDALVARTNEVGDLLRCPVCQGLSVSDSPATMAVNMKAQVREMLAAGYDQEQILSYFERSYGEFVRLQPPLRGVNWLVWLTPILGLVAGAIVVMRVLRSPARTAGKADASALRAGSPAADAPGPDALPEDPLLANQVLRVRELAYGWPGGRSFAATAAQKPARTPKTPESRS